MRLKHYICKMLGEKRMGLIDYYLYPIRSNAWGGPFNGQPKRQRLFCSIIDQLRPAALIETGTYLGTTTEYLATTGLPVFTIEANARNYGFCTARFWSTSNVHLSHGDSRTVLRALFDGPLSAFKQQTLFAYLDAHWNTDLPLAGELEILFGECSRAVAMIDDFEVPFEPGYAFDDYGPGKTLTSAYIAPAATAYGLQAFYPSAPACQEGGRRRGCVVVARKATHGQALSSLATLRPEVTSS